MNDENRAGNGTEDRAAPRLAFVAGGGAIKAYAFHIGVLYELQADGFRFHAGTRWQNSAAPGPRVIDTYVGSSAGACTAASLASGHSIDDMLNAILGTSKRVPTFGYRVMYTPVAPHPWRYAKRVMRRLMLGLMRPHHLLDVAGLFTAAGMERYFRRHVLPTNRFADLAPRLFLVATQVNGYRKVVFGPADSLGEHGYGSECAWYNNVEISEALAAAVSLPPLFAPFGIANPATGRMFHYHDGEVREPLSLHVARDAGAPFAIASSIWRPYAYQERVGSLANFGMMTIAEQALHQAIEQKVARDRLQAERVERGLEVIARHGKRLGMSLQQVEALQGDVAGALHHRRMRVLQVEPEPRDGEFFFQGSLRFHAGLIKRCVDAGRRAYRHAAQADPSFFAELDASARTSNEPANPAVEVGAVREPQLENA